MNDPQFPIGKFHFEGPPSEDQREQLIAEIEQAPAALRSAVKDLSPQQLDTSYREGGWTVRQVVHHVPDSHLNAYVRFKLALTEETPTIRPYDEAAWAELSDSRDTPLETSLVLLDALHDRWVRLLRAMSEGDFRRTLKHPEHGGPMTLDAMLGLYAW